MVSAADLPDFAAAVEELGGESEDDRVLLARTISGEGRSRAFVGGASVPASQLAEVAEPLVAVHGQSDQHRLLRPAAQRDALDRFGGDKTAALLRRYTDLHARLVAAETELTEVVTTARERAREADLLRFGLEEIEAVSPEPGEDVQLAADESRLGFADTLRSAAEQARESLSAEHGGPDALGATSAARTFLEGVREHDTEAAELADRLAEVSYLLSDVAADVASYASRLDTDPARLAAVSERRAALTALTRKYGDTIDEVLAWSEQSSRRLLELDNTDERLDELRALRTRLRAELADGRRGAVEGTHLDRDPARCRGHRRARAAGDAARPGQPGRRPARGRAAGPRRGPRRAAAGGGPVAAVHRHRRRRRRVPAGRQHRRRPARAAQGRLRR